MQIRTAYTVVDDLLQRALGVEAHVHPHLHEHGDDAGVLADRSMTFRAHPRIDEDLRDCILRCWRFFVQVRLMHRLDEVERVVIRDELQRVRDARDQIVLVDDALTFTRHDRTPLRKGRYGTRVPQGGQTP
jgi:hypothetical protein